MNDQASSFDTWDVIQDLGFEPDPTAVMPGLSFDFGNFELKATCVWHLQFGAVVMFSGVLSTPRTLAYVNFEIARSIVTSRELCAAWIVSHLDRQAMGGVFQPARDVPWLAEGRLHRHLLPWVIEEARLEREAAAYRARPCCMVRKEWLKLALKTLAEHVAAVADTEPVVFAFDGHVLSIRCAANAVVLTGEGKPWTTEYAIPAGQLRKLPKRLYGDRVNVSVWGTRLEIDRLRYDGIESRATATKPNALPAR